MAHIHELIDWTVGIYIVHENKVFIRLHEKYNIWIHVGGHIELDEDPLTAAKRECLEEVGLEVKILGEDSLPSFTDEPRKRELPIPAHLNIHYIQDTNHQHIDLIYYGTSNSVNVTPENNTDKWVWLTREEVENHPDFLQATKHYALGALEALRT